MNNHPKVPQSLDEQQDHEYMKTHEDSWSIIEYHTTKAELSLN